MIFKRILSIVCATLFTLITNAQQKMKTYDAEWKQVDTLILKKGLTESALTAVNKIYTLAKKEGNDAQVIKALLYRLELQNIKQEDPAKKNIQQLEAETATAKEPVRSILQSITAGNYWTWFQQHRWQLYRRTETINFKKDDIATWSTDDFHKKISELYLASVSNEKILQQTRLDIFDPIIIKGNARYLRPTLFDLLAHRAIDYFKNDERTISKPAYAFEIDDEAAFADVKAFTKHTFTTRDSLSLYFKALQLFQRILSFHINDAKPDALLDANIERLAFVNDHGVMENKDKLYKQALDQITNQYALITAAAQAWYLTAAWYSNKAQQYNPLKSDSNRFDNLKAKDICEKVIAQTESSEGRTNCESLLHQILRKELNLQTERVNVPDQPFRTLVTWRNFTQLNFRLVKMDRKTRDAIGADNWQDEYWKKLLKLPVIKTFNQTLPDTKDYQQHATEIKTDALPIGEYALIASVNNNFSLSNNQLAVQYFYVSNIAFINKGTDYFVLHRETGAPIANAGVQVWYRSYDYNVRKYTESKGNNSITDANGYTKIITGKKEDQNNYKLEITTGNDRLFLDDYQYNYRYNDAEVQAPGEKEQKSTFLFTDRSIYRPSQTLYFKGILVKRNAQTREISIVPNFATSVTLTDANGQQVDTIKVTTNEFGAYSGKITLPTGLLNGEFSLTDNTSQTNISFSVEEYKRPKFLVELSKPAGTYKINDDIKVTGTAKAYAGNNIDGAVVKYRVVRKVIMPMWLFGAFYKMIWPPHGSEQVEIAHGQTTTDTKGEFHIRFKALPDRTIAKQEQPIFYYEITTDVTDAAGETRSGNTQVAVGYQALRLTLTVPEKMHTDSLKNIKLSSTNLNNVFEKTTATVSIYKLKTPDRLFRERYWPQPDTFVLSQQEYYSLFQYDVYKDENNPARWPKDQKVWEKTDSTSKSDSFTIDHSPFTAGFYAIEAITKDKYGEEVKDIRYVQLYDQSIASPMASGSIESNKTIAEPGETIKYQVSTTVEDAFVVHEVTKKDNKDERTFLTLSKNSRSFELPVTEKDRGGFGVQIAFVKHNREYSDNQTFVVPYSNKDLTISYETFRDKTLPGSEEKWKVKISGYKGDKVTAEMLTAMYDASLDQFKPHKWEKPSLWDYFSPKDRWDGAIGFKSVQSIEKYTTEEGYSYFEKTYDRLGVPGIENSGMFAGGRGDYRLMAKSARKGEEVALEAAAPAATDMVYRNVEQHGDFNFQGDKAKKQDTLQQPKTPDAAVQIRKNFNETAFFFPDLHTDANGVIEFSFTMPEAVTQWKWMSLAHTKELAFGYDEKTIVTQKDLMVQPNAPRFLREGDRIDFSGKIVNLTDKEITGQVQLQLFDATTNQSVDGWFRNMYPNQYFTVAAKQSVPVNFSLEIPYQYNKPVTYRMVAKANAAGGQEGPSDGEEAMLPVVSNRMLVTESLPLPVRGNGTKNFVFEKLLKSGSSETLNHHAVTVEFTANPAWYAVQALPYLMEYPYDCAEQIFNRYYANTLAGTIANASPKIKQIFEKWKTADTAALLSNLQKNQELKSVLLEETPWVLQAKSESQQKKNIALLFDLVRMSKELETNINKLRELQSPNGGFVWFKGGQDDRYMTQYILTGIGHLKKLHALPANDQNITAIIKMAIPYLDARIKEDYENMLKYNKQQPLNEDISALHVQYLYMRSFFNDYGVPANVYKAFNYYRTRSQQSWVKQSRYLQGMIALSLFRTGDVQTARNIVASLKQNALNSDEMGMYWKEVTGGYYWYQAPVETQSLLMETFNEVTHDTEAVNDMKVWLLKQKQTQNWKTTKATADACYALLLQGTDWLTGTPEITIDLGNTAIRSKDQQQEAGTGYFKKVIDGKQVKPEMGNVKVTVSSPTSGNGAGVSWGAIYWQYFENLDKITSAATPLQLNKKLFVEKNTDRGPVLQPVNEGDALKVGDKVKVRVELRVDRNMEYVHMKDMRGACMEPVNVISEYKWQGGLGYYESTKDASTNFFFGWLPKGTYVFEYPLFVTHTGTFSNGVTTIQCMYAPEFTSHSEGVKVKVE